MSQRESLEVRMDDRLVGTLALTANHKVAFSYSEEWLEHGFSVSPFSLPLKNEVFDPDDKLEGKHSKESKHMVLVVEDNPEMLAFIERQLSSQYAVITATNGKEALEALDSNFVNLVVSDVVMPLMDGFELCKTIKSNVGYSHIPIILLTAKTNIQSKIEGMELGADSYIEKPFSPEYLLAVVSNLINNREKLRREICGFNIRVRSQFHSFNLRLDICLCS